MVDAQTFDGKGPSEWATKVQLDAVNQTAGNATQTAQAAATVANNALEVAQGAGFSIEKLWERAPSTMRLSVTATLNKPITDYKMYVIVFQTIIDTPARNTIRFEVGVVSERALTTKEPLTGSLLQSVYTNGSSLLSLIRAYRFDGDDATKMVFYSTNNDDSCIPTAVYGIK